MKNIIVLIFLATLFSCNSGGSKFKGKWVDKNSERDVIEIQKNNDNFLILLRGNKHFAELRDDILEMDAGGVSLKIFIDENNSLFISGEEYIRIEESKLYPYLGKWKTKYTINNGKKNPFSSEDDKSVTLIIDNVKGAKITCDAYAQNLGKSANCRNVLGIFFKNIFLQGNVLKIKSKSGDILEFVITDDNYLALKETYDDYKEDSVLFEKVE